MSGLGGGYPSDLTDEQWAMVEPSQPPPQVGPKGGRREKHPRRRIVDAIALVRLASRWAVAPRVGAPGKTVWAELSVSRQ
ncbi:transposase [Streptomyces sp. MUM 203J]|uniref:transposase n=1 Tax=Streptomyces sp. MUM 203J TaxID=2791990 RepID=UPI0035ABEE7F|nr:transposase [Streptomyces sp. MUM 203J]